MTDFVGFTQEQVLELIQLYRENTLLWDSNEHGYKNVRLREQVWEAIGEHMGVGAVKCKRKIHSLQAQMRREIARSLRDKTYESKWYAYKHLEFLVEKYQKNSSEYQIIKEENCATDYNTDSDENFEFVDTNNINDTKQIKDNQNNVKKSEIENNCEPEINNSPKKLKTEFHDINYASNLSSEIHYPEPVHQERDEYLVYGETVAHRLRKINNPKKVCILKHKIDVLLYEAELESYPETE